MVVKRAVETLRDGVLGKNVRIEEGLFHLNLKVSQCQIEFSRHDSDQKIHLDSTYASLEAPIRCWMTAVVSCLQAASIGTSLGSVALRLAEGKVLVANVGVVAVAVEGCVDGAAELGWAVIASDSCRRGSFIVS